MADIFDVIADPTRRDLLVALRERHASIVAAPTSRRGAAPFEMGVGELVEKLQLSQPTVSKHLKVLRDANLVSVREVGQRRYYRLNALPLEVIEAFVVPFLESAPIDAGTSAAVDEDALAVFAAWSGTHLPAPLRRAAETFEHSEERGAAIGRAVADASFRTRSAFDDAASGVRDRVISPISKRIHR